jgi:hypothetical protein
MMAIQVTTGDRDDDKGRRERLPRWLLLLLAALAALVVGQSAGILAAAGGSAIVAAIWTGFGAFGAALALMLTVIGFLTNP